MLFNNFQLLYGKNLNLIFFNRANNIGDEGAGCISSAI